jgi:hypothetical protein
MPEEQRQFNILFRKPKYPMIVLSKDNLMTAFNIKELAICCITAKPEKEGGVVKSIDSTGEEFWYSPENSTIAPGFAFKRWTKKQIIELYNNSKSASNNAKYSFKSLSNKRLTHIISDICDLLKS